MMFTASGLGMWFTALSIQYRDINYGMGFFVQLLMYVAPVVYPSSVSRMHLEHFMVYFQLQVLLKVLELFYCKQFKCRGT